VESALLNCIPLFFGGWLAVLRLVAQRLANSIARRTLADASPSSAYRRGDDARARDAVYESGVRDALRRVRQLWQ